MKHTTYWDMFYWKLGWTQKQVSLMPFLDIWIHFVCTSIDAFTLLRQKCYVAVQLATWFGRKLLLNVEWNIVWTSTIPCWDHQDDRMDLYNMICRVTIVSQPGMRFFLLPLALQGGYVFFICVVYSSCVFACLFSFLYHEPSFWIPPFHGVLYITWRLQNSTLRSVVVSLLVRIELKNIQLLTYPFNQAVSA